MVTFILINDIKRQKAWICKWKKRAMSHIQKENLSEYDNQLQWVWHAFWIELPDLPIQTPHLLLSSCLSRWTASSNPLESYITFDWQHLKRLSPTNLFLLTFHFSLELSIALRCPWGFSPIRLSHFYFSPLTISLWCLQRFSPIRLSHFYFSPLTIALWCLQRFSPIRLSHFHFLSTHHRLMMPTGVFTNKTLSFLYFFPDFLCWGRQVVLHNVSSYPLNA